MSDVNVKVGLTKEHFDTGLAKLRSSLAGFKKEQESSFGGLGTKISGAFAGALSVGAIVQFGKSMIEMGSNINDTADEVQLTTDSLQELTYAFGQNGANSEVAVKGLKKLSENIQTARDGNEKMIASFGRAGVSWADLNRLSPEQILGKLADGLHNIKDPAEAVSLALDLMGKSGAKMAVTLRQGAPELARLREEASKLAAGEIKALDEAGDKIDTIINKLKVMAARGFLGIINPASLVAEPEKGASQQQAVNQQGAAFMGMGGMPSQPSAPLADIAMPNAALNPTLSQADRDKAGVNNEPLGPLPYGDSTVMSPAEEKSHRAHEDAQKAEFQLRTKAGTADADLQEKLDLDRLAQHKKSVEDGNAIYLKGLDEKRDADKKAATESIERGRATEENMAALAAEFREKKKAAEKAAIEFQALPAEERRAAIRAADHQKDREKQAGRIIKGREADKERNKRANARPDFGALFGAPALAKAADVQPPKPVAAPELGKMEGHLSSLASNLAGMRSELQKLNTA